LEDYYDKESRISLHRQCAKRDLPEAADRRRGRPAQLANTTHPKRIQADTTQEKNADRWLGRAKAVWINAPKHDLKVTLPATENVKECHILSGIKKIKSGDFD
jgi:hypothetical protein